MRQVQPRRWVAERVFGRFGGFRRLSKDDEDELVSSEALIFAAMSYLLLRRFTRLVAPASSPDG